MRPRREEEVEESEVSSGDEVSEEGIARDEDDEDNESEDESGSNAESQVSVSQFQNMQVDTNQLRNSQTKTKLPPHPRSTFLPSLSEHSLAHKLLFRLQTANQKNPKRRLPQKTHRRKHQLENQSPGTT